MSDNHAFTGHDVCTFEYPGRYCAEPASASVHQYSGAVKRANVQIAVARAKKDDSIYDLALAALAELDGEDLINAIEVSLKGHCTPDNKGDFFRTQGYRDATSVKAHYEIPEIEYEGGVTPVRRVIIQARVYKPITGEALPS